MSFTVRFEYLPGVRRDLFSNVRLTGSWDGQGRYSNNWTTGPMTAFTAEDGCPAWRATVDFDESQQGYTFHWGVMVDGPAGANVWGIPTEVHNPAMRARHRDFALVRDGQAERYWLTHCRRLGANKRYVSGGTEPRIQFSAYAPHAIDVETVIGEPEGGYIWNNGNGVQARYAMTRDDEGVWHTDLHEAALSSFADLDHTPYMFHVTKDDQTRAFRTDMYSRCQIGSGKAAPEGDGNWDGRRQSLDGTKSCSVVVDPERVTKLFREGVWPETQWLTEEEFWRDEFDAARPVPTRLADLVIYELHMGSLGFGRQDPGNLQDAIDLLDHLVALGVNAVELLPMSEYRGWADWGYGNSHYFAIEFTGGGRDQFKFFIRECHRRGIAVILDVVYNHFTEDAERAEWMYDTNANEDNFYYWYQGHPGDYADYERAAAHPDAKGWPVQGHGGYLDNGSSGYSPNFRNEMVRKMFISSAVMLALEFHVDGYRVDLTQSIHRDHVLHANGQILNEAQMYGQKFLREWVRTLKLVNPTQFLIAEDHSDWGAITQPQEWGGVGFDAIWWAEWDHNLIGDATSDNGKARLIKRAGYGGNEQLPIGTFANVLRNSPRRVVYHECHDHSGNATITENGREYWSGRTMSIAVNWQVEPNRFWAEARSRLAVALTMLSPGVPMFFMGEEVGASRPFRHDSFLNNRENILDLRMNSGGNLFRFYQDLISLRRSNGAFAEPNLDVVYEHNDNRVLSFRRWDARREFLVVATLNNRSFGNGYNMWNPSLGDGQWVERLNSDASIYGGSGMVNGGALRSNGGNFMPLLPANSVLVFERV